MKREVTVYGKYFQTSSFVLSFSFVLMWPSAQVGLFLRKRQLKIEDVHQDHAVIVSATLTATGVIRVLPQNLISLAQSLHGN